jgi:hypothetical protein
LHGYSAELYSIPMGGILRLFWREECDLDNKGANLRQISYTSRKNGGGTIMTGFLRAVPVLEQKNR